MKAGTHRKLSPKEPIWTPEGYVGHCRCGYKTEPMSSHATRAQLAAHVATQNRKERT